MNRVLKDYLAKNDYKKVAADCVEWIRSWFLENGPESPAVIGISGGKHVQMASGGAHLLDGRRLQILVDFLGVFAVFCVPCAHGLHLPALAIQTAVNVFQRLLYAVPVHHVLAVQRLADFVQV